jgi:hypothetical protein
MIKNVGTQLKYFRLEHNPGNAGLSDQFQFLKIDVNRLLIR